MALALAANAIFAALVISERGVFYYPIALSSVGGVALHGTYWHDQFGSGFRLSHGCINLGMDDAE